MVSRTAAGSCARRRSRWGWAPPRRAGFVRKQGSNGDRQQDRIASRQVNQSWSLQCARVASKHEPAGSLGACRPADAGGSHVTLLLLPTSTNSVAPPAGQPALAAHPLGPAPPRSRPHWRSRRSTWRAARWTRGPRLQAGISQGLGIEVGLVHMAGREMDSGATTVHRW